MHLAFDPRQSDKLDRTFWCYIVSMCSEAIFRCGETAEIASLEDFLAQASYSRTDLMPLESGGLRQPAVDGVAGALQDGQRRLFQQAAFD